MTKERSDSLGSYFSNSFIIKCNTDIDFNNLSKCDSYNQLGTFIHEYIHFLQNISTTYGNMNMTYYYAKTLSRLHNISTSTSKYVQVSQARFLPSSVDDAEIICDLTLGDTDEWTYDTISHIEILSISVSQDPCIEKKFAPYTLPILELKISSGNISQTKNFRFGARAISESMAAIYEKRIYSISSTKVQVQYDICTILWNKYAPKIYKNRTDLVFAMCECSLMFPNPGIMFYSVLKFLIANETNPITLKMIFNYFTKQPDFFKLHKHYYKEMLHNFDYLFPQNKYMSNLNKYVHNFSYNLFQKRQENFHWITDLYVLEPFEMKSKLFNVIEQTKAIPLIINNDNEIYSGIVQEIDKMDMIYFYTIYAFNNLIDHFGDKECLLIPICNKSLSSEIDANCMKSPWLKCNNHSLCPIGVLWYMWNLSEKELLYE